MAKFSLFLLPATLACLFFAAPGSAQDGGPAAMPAAQDWTSWGYDQQRTGWNRGETTLSKNNVSHLKLLWSSKVTTPVTDVALSTLTAPLVVQSVATPQGPRNMVFLLGADDTLFALDADSGKTLWQKTYPNTTKPVRPGTWLCSNTANATPVIDKAKGVIYFAASDGKLRGLALSDGAERLAATDFVNPFARAWSLNLVGNIIYTTHARGCGQIPGQIAQGATVSNASSRPTQRGPIEGGGITAIDIADPQHPRLVQYYTSGGRESGPWGRGGVALGPDGVVYTQTADGVDDAAGGALGESVLALSPRAEHLNDTFTPDNWRFLNQHDLDMGSASPIIFPLAGKTVLATGCKEGVIYLLDAANLGGGPPNHATPLLKGPQAGNDPAYGGNTNAPGWGIWGSMATTVTADGRRFIYVPMWGPASSKTPLTYKYSYGAAPNGSIMAFEVTSDGGKIGIVPQWISPDMTVPDPPVVANGVVYAIQTGEQTVQNPVLPPGTPRQNPSTVGAHFRATPVSNLVLYALDAETGKTLFTSKKMITDWVHFSEPVVALGKVFVVTHDAHVYAFGLKR